MRNILLIVAVFIGASAYVSAQPEGDSPNRGRLMWSAFTCATFAELSGNEEEQTRLFAVGYAVGTEFVREVKEKTISESEFNAAPVGVLLTLGGPSVDFIVGRIFENAMNDAFDSVVKEDSNGLTIPDPTKWARDELKAIRAENKYHNSNCELLR
ncbi:MAG: hypothetical protein RQ757_11455 [Pseudomonadales bacterium]|nr:hypothetical protein [Pseudomonadales bacterium]